MRRFLRFRLRSIFILTTLIAMGLAWWSHRAQRQRRAVTTLCKNSAVVMYKYENNRLKPYWNGFSPWPWYIDYQYKVTKVYLLRPTRAADEMALQALDGLEEVYLRDGEPREIGRLQEAFPRCRVQRFDTWR
ncbi:MAG: hypothetical protein K8T91_06550 [Planctomycetes bacterium]|nr:hypothetical protein [Planctomycetota bacterium]